MRAVNRLLSSAVGRLEIVKDLRRDLDEAIRHSAKRVRYVTREQAYEICATSEFIPVSCYPRSYGSMPYELGILRGDRIVEAEIKD